MYGYVCVYLSLIQGYLVRLYNIVICLIAIYLYNSFFFSLLCLLGLFDIILLLLLLPLMLLLMLSPDHDNIFVYHCHCCQRLIFGCRFLFSLSCYKNILLCHQQFVCEGGERKFT